MSLIIPNTFADKSGSVQLSLLDENFTEVSTGLTTLQSELSADISAINLLQLTQASTNLSGVGGVLDTLLPSGETSGYVLSTTGAGSYLWAAQTGGVGNVGTKIDTTRQTFTATANQTVFNLTGITYTPGSGQLRVYIDGVRQFPAAYTENSTTQFTLSTGVTVGTKVLAEIDGYVSYPIAASDISYIPAGGSTLSATTVQGALTELEAESQVLQTVYNVYTSNTTYAVPAYVAAADGSSNGTFMAILQTTITPKKSTSRIKIELNITCEVHNDTVFRLFRSTVAGGDVQIGKNNDNNRWSGWALPGYDADNNTTAMTNHYIYIDTPATTAAVTYKFMIQSAGVAATTLYLNRTIASAGAANNENGISQVILTEIL